MNQNTQNSRRIRSMKLMELLQPFTQTGTLSSNEANSFVALFLKGETDFIVESMMEKEFPDYLMEALSNLLEFLS